MASITPSASPGSYLDPQNISFTFSPDVVSVAVTKNAAAPSISKYIAYDTLTPANPFIAVTEDGRGRVVYDGGFPKFYNGSFTGVYNVFADLNPAGKYLHNAFKWTANPAKVASGNKKVLILGDAISTVNYAVKSDGPNGFFTAITKICAVAGFTPTFKDISDYAGILNPTLAELEQYCCVLVMGGDHRGDPLITSQAVGDIAAYRENGNGVILITDHGFLLTNIEQMKTPHSGFFRTVNEIAYRFGAYFSGDFERTPVNVGFLRQNYGDHPLYAGLTDAEAMPAGGSESKVVVTQTATTPPNAVAPINVSQSGLNTINVLVTLTDGSVVTARYVYNIQGEEFLFLGTTNPAGNVTEENKGTAFANVAGQMTASVRLAAQNMGTVWGEILLDGKRVGEVYSSAGVANEYWYAGAAANTPVLDGSKLEVAIAVPFSYSKISTVNRVKAGFSKAISLAALFSNSRTYVTGTTPRFFKKSVWVTELLTQINASLTAPNRRQPVLSLASNLRVLRDFLDNRIQTVDNLQGRIYSTTVATQAAIAATAVTPGTIFIDAQTNKVYGYKSGTYQLIAGLTAHDIYGFHRKVTSTVDGNKQYYLESNGSITKLN
jgi:hypothetical protein